MKYPLKSKLCFSLFVVAYSTNDSGFCADLAIFSANNKIEVTSSFFLYSCFKLISITVHVEAVYRDYEYCMLI